MTSPAEGLVFYAPIVVLALPGCLMGLRKRRYDSALLVVVLVALVGVYAKWIRCDAGWAWGTRYLVPIVPLLMIWVAEVWEWAERRRSTFVYGLLSLIALLTVIVQLVGVIGNFVEAEFARQEMYSIQGDDWYHLGRRALFDIRTSPLLLLAQSVWRGEWDVSWMSQGTQAP